MPIYLQAYIFQFSFFFFYEIGRKLSVEQETGAWIIEYLMIEKVWSCDPQTGSMNGTQNHDDNQVILNPARVTFFNFIS